MVDESSGRYDMNFYECMVLFGSFWIALEASSQSKSALNKHIQCMYNFFFLFSFVFSLALLLVKKCHCFSCNIAFQVQLKSQKLLLKSWVKLALLCYIYFYPIYIRPLGRMGSTGWGWSSRMTTRPHHQNASLSHHCSTQMSTHQVHLCIRVSFGVSIQNRISYKIQSRKLKDENILVKSLTASYSVEIFMDENILLKPGIVQCLTQHVQLGVSVCHTPKMGSLFF